ncbi:MAG: DUF262 domain-containing protein [Methylococcales symbiont of Iophon sp. n. MRB-2018]|nr:MAG: DUF262 domain-containing protein [Methylococcales symbiont of Iophon sp. n. MRB-2018]KAF3980808.1 MAG: DUF262 domain-containing protein [Methylococcales symbiont of Iophon sp. n. MRB-2018]
MKNQTTTIRKIVKQLNKGDVTDGGFWLPNIQRNFVWKEYQTERLFDSLMRDYPIGTLLVWKTKSNIKHRKFIDIYKNDTNFTAFYMPENNKCKLLVLDGQQRLQNKEEIRRNKGNKGTLPFFRSTHPFKTQISTNLITQIFNKIITSARG